MNTKVKREHIKEHVSSSEYKERPDYNKFIKEQTGPDDYYGYEVNFGYSINTYMKTDIDESPVGDLKRFIKLQ